MVRAALFSGDCGLPGAGDVVGGCGDEGQPASVTERIRSLAESPQIGHGAQTDLSRERFSADKRALVIVIFHSVAPSVGNSQPIDPMRATAKRFRLKCPGLLQP